jgi:hypothetical protein
MLPGCCPSCGFSGEVEAFLVEPDAKRAIARVAALEPALGRVIGPYLRLFGAGKRGLQLRRAVKLIDELVALIDVGTVCRDERGDVRRPANAAVWAAGVEQLLTSPPSGQLQNHHYLRSIVFGLADKVDAAAERQREEQVRSGGHRVAPSATAREEDALTNALRYAEQMVKLAGWTPEQRDEYVNAARSRSQP